MIYRLRKKFIKICMLAFVGVFVLLFSTIYLLTYLQTNIALDNLADIISENNGVFPEHFVPPEDQQLRPQRINSETPFTTRFFTVRYNASGQLLSVDLRSVASVTKEEAAHYAEKALGRDRERGWIDNYRYKIYQTDDGSAVVFINGSGTKDMNQSFLLAASLVFIAGSLVVLLVVILTSKRMVKPVAESYEKQKQFITDANHELKTPLTLIRTNLDIMEAETGSSEWLSDVREETGIMTELVNQLVELARMDEEQIKLDMQPFNLSDMALDIVSVFEGAICRSGKSFVTNISPEIVYMGNEAAIRRLFLILLDNASKYCDPDGVIRVTLEKGKGQRPVIAVDNTYTAVCGIELNRLFDRFYRADKARTYGSGFGIGLSMAKAIVQKHHDEISAANLDNRTIRFRVRL